jgi:hypothetical protein
VMSFDCAAACWIWPVQTAVVIWNCWSLFAFAFVVVIATVFAVVTEVVFALADWWSLAVNFAFVLWVAVLSTFAVSAA